MPRELAWVLNGSGHPKDASAVLGRAIAAASSTDNIDLALQLEVQRLSIDLAPPNEIKARMEPYRERIRARDIGRPALARRGGVAADVDRRGRAPGRGAGAASARRLADLRWSSLTSTIPSQLVLVLAVAEDFELAERALEVMLAGARAIGSVPLEGASLGLRSELEFRRGMIAGAAADARTAIEIARAHAFVPAMPLIIAWITQALIERGELAEAARELEICGMEVEVPDHMSFTPDPQLPRDGWSWAEGKHRRALEDLMEIGRREARSETSFFSWDSDAGGRAGVARRAGRGRAPRGARARAGSALGDGRAGWAMRPGRSGWWREAMTESSICERRWSCCKESPAGLEYMRALTDFGAALRRAGRRADAREPLREALELARRCGALAIARRAHEELAATGEKLRPLVAVGVESLTPSERRIAGLAAEGLTNREIAQTLFLSVKTVESHLRGAYRKLDVRSREELPHALEGDGEIGALRPRTGP